MRVIPIIMRFSIFQLPRCRLHTLASFWQESFHSLPAKSGNSSSFRLHGIKADSLEGGYSRRWIRRPLSTKTNGTEKSTQSKSKSSITRNNILDEKVSTSATLSIRKTEISEFQDIPYFDSRQEILKHNDLANLVTVISFDLETTGTFRDKDRIIEIALQDLHGGENSTFETLVNPGCSILNYRFHNIQDHMVCRSHVPRMKELIPILLEFIWSRQKPGGYVLLVAHNGRSFDVPFLVNEFNRCGFDIPPNWLFLDTMALARKWAKSEGLDSRKINLQLLAERFKIKREGDAHRAMSDVKLLSVVFQKLSLYLKASLPSLVAESFTVSDLEQALLKKQELEEAKKKKNSR